MMSGRLRSTCRATAVVVFTVGMLVIAGWLFRVRGASRFHPAWGTMSSHAAFCFVFAGFSLFFAADPRASAWRRTAAQLTAAVVVIVSVLTLATHYRLGLGIDQVLTEPLAAMFPGRMPVATSLAFLACGLALLLLDVEVRGHRPSEYLSFVAVWLALLALVAFTFNFISLFFEIPSRRSMAFHTIFLLMALAFGILAARPHAGLMGLATGRDATGVMLRRLLPAAFVIPIVAGWMIMEAQRARIFPPTLNVSYYALLLVVIFTALVWRTAVSVSRIDLRRQAAEEQVRKLNAELEQRVSDRTAELAAANSELEAFSYSVSHDLRAPLRAINGFSSILLRDHSGELRAEAQQHLGRVSDASRRMGNLIDALLGLSRVTRNPMQRGPVSLTTVVNEVASDLRRDDPDRTVDVRVDPDLSAIADLALLRIVLENLLRNAWKFTGATPHAIIHVGARRDGAVPVFFVRDNGAGFEMAYVDKLFGAFQRLHHEKDFEGTGIGLATVQRIVRRHGGRVWAEGAVGKGATFYFTLQHE
jgi:signal transduction histidine kinase